MIGEGLLKYGYREDAADLVTRLMNAVISNLKTHSSFFNYYHQDSGVGMGERNSLGGLAPLGLFLETLGVRVISANKVYLIGKNPFPWPVTVRYRGLIINRETQRTKITFPGGQTAVVKSEEPRLVTLEETNEKRHHLKNQKSTNLNHFRLILDTTNEKYFEIHSHFYLGDVSGWKRYC